MVASEITEQVSDLDYLLGVKSYCRLVEDDDLGVSDERLRDADSLTVALGEILDKALVNVLDLDYLADLLEVLCTVELAVLEVVAEDKVLFYGHIEIERGLLGQIAYVLLCFHRVVQHVNARYLNDTRCGREVTRKDIHSGTLTRAIRAKEADDLTLFDLKADVVNSAVRAVIFH